MPDSLATVLEQTIRAHRPFEVSAPWADEIVFPAYDGLSIRNLAHTVVRLLDGKPSQAWLGSSPLDGRLWEHLWGQAKRVVLFLSDGLGWRFLNEIIAADPEAAQIVADLTGSGTLVPITSIAPSTTAAALPCLWTGAAPAATGMIGSKVFLRELGMLVDLLHYKPATGRHRAEVIEEWGFDFNTFVPLQTLGEALTERLIPSYVLLEKSLYGSGLSRLMHRGVQSVTRHYGYTDLWITLRNLLRQTRGERCFVSVYWAAVDSISHLHGTVSEASITEVRRQLGDLRDTLAADGVADGRTLFMFAADHGHTPVPDHITIADHAPLAEALRCAPGGEGRFAHFYLRHDYRAQAAEYIQSCLGDRFACLVPSEALAAGLFGPELPYAETAPRLGDLTVIARQGWTIGDRPRGTMAALSRHGGLSDQEMLVPLLLRPL